MATSRRRIRESLHTLGCGFAVGTADVVPGVSGGTIAFVLGIYERFISALSRFDLDTLRLALRFRVAEIWQRVDATFLLLLSVGIYSAVLFFTRVVSLPHLVRTQPETIYALFFGLIAASVVVLLRDIKGFGGRDAVLLLLGVLVGWWVVNLVPVETPETWWFVLFCGFIGISAMLLPGISGSFVLLVMKKYAYIFDAFGRLDFSILVPFFVGEILGLLVFARVFKWLLSRFHRATLVFICGLLIGSLWIIWPFQTREFEVVRGKERLIGSTPAWPDAAGDFLVPGVLMLVGLGVVLSVAALARRRGAPPA